MEMKKCLYWGAVILAAVLVTGCQSVLIDGRTGFASAPGGLLFSDFNGGLIVQDRHPSRKFKVLGKVDSKAASTSYLTLFTIGDSSYQLLKKLALEKYPDADDIIDVELDFHHDNVFLIVNKLTVHLNGTAVKYLDMPAKR